MNLPHPFEKAKDVKANPDGTINLIDDQCKPLARIPMSTAFELSPEVEGHGYGLGYGYGYGSGYAVGFGYGEGVGFGDGYGDGE